MDELGIHVVVLNLLHAQSGWVNGCIEKNLLSQLTKYFVEDETGRAGGANAGIVMNQVGVDRHVWEHVYNTKLVHTLLRKHFTSGVILVFTLLYGKSRLTVHQYSKVASLIRNTRAMTRLPCHGKIRKRLVPYLIDRTFASSKVMQFNITKDKDGLCRLLRMKLPMLISPVSWAVMYMACVDVATQLLSNENSC